MNVYKPLYLRVLLAGDLPSPRCVRASKQAVASSGRIQYQLVSSEEETPELHEVSSIVPDEAPLD